MSLLPLGQSHWQVTGLKTRPGGHLMAGQTQEQVLLLKILGLGQGVGVQQAHWNRTGTGMATRLSAALAAAVWNQGVRLQ